MAPRFLEGIATALDRWQILDMMAQRKDMSGKFTLCSPDLHIPAENFNMVCKVPTAKLS